MAFPDAYLFVAVSDLDIALCRGPLQTILERYGIDTTQPYQGRAFPALSQHRYWQQRDYVHRWPGDNAHV